MAGWKIRRHNWMDRRRGTSKKTDRLKTTGRSSDPIHKTVRLRNSLFLAWPV